MPRIAEELSGREMLSSAGTMLEGFQFLCFRKRLY